MLVETRVFRLFCTIMLQTIESKVWVRKNNNVCSFYKFCLESCLQKWFEAVFYEKPKEKSFSVLHFALNGIQLGTEQQRIRLDNLQNPNRMLLALTLVFLRKCYLGTGLGNLHQLCMLCHCICQSNFFCFSQMRFFHYYHN